MYWFSPLSISYQTFRLCLRLFLPFIFWFEVSILPGYCCFIDRPNIFNLHGYLSSSFSLLLFSFCSPRSLLQSFLSLWVYMYPWPFPHLFLNSVKKKSIRAEGDFIVLTALNLWDRNKDKKRRRKRKESSRKEWKENFDMLTFLSTPSYFPIHFSFHQVNNISYFISCFFIISPYSRA